MRFRDRPLLADGLDATLYLDRPQVERQIAAPLAEGRNVLVLGEAGSGKSTLLRKVAGTLEEEARPAVLVNAGLADDASGLLALVDAALEERLHGGSGGSVADTEPRSTRLLQAARRLRRDRPATILLDDMTNADVAYDIFGRLRDELWSLEHSWAVATRPRDSAPLRTPPADAFWSSVVEIPPLANGEAERLLRLGLTDDEYKVVGRDRPITDAYPRFLIRWAQDKLSREENSDDAAAPWQWHLERASELGRSEAIAVAELQGLGRPVSAHESEFLERLGWSRPYAQRILANLEEHGILRSIPERRDQPGRPRKLYELQPNPPNK